MEEARSSAHAVYDQLQKESESKWQSYERFHNNLALFSGGTIALSVTYLGYLQSQSVPVSQIWLLISSWALMLLSSILSLFAPFYRTHYLHYSRVKEYSQKKKRQYEIEGEELPNVPLVGIANAQEFQEYLTKLEEAVDNLHKNENWAHRREKLFEFVWIWSSRFASVFFVTGLALLFGFAVFNIA